MVKTIQLDVCNHSIVGGTFDYILKMYYELDKDAKLNRSYSMSIK